jgi:flagellar biogenesis protein FliO
VKFSKGKWRTRGTGVRALKRFTHGLKARATRRLVCAALVLLLFASGVLGQTPLPRTALGDEPIRSTSVQPATGGAAVSAPVPQSMEYGRVLGALGVVIALIFVLRWAARVFFPSVAGKTPSRIVEVLGRSVLTPKQQVVLIRVGRRIIVVGDSGSQLNTLCEIADPDEIASLVGQLREEKLTAASAFGSLFGRFTRRFEAAEESDAPSLQDGEPMPADTEATAQSELDGLRDRVRRLAEQFK